MSKSLEIERRVRWYQRPLHEYMLNGGKRAIEIAHRRWGKDEIALGVTCELAHRRIGSYWHCLPEYAQARKAIWAAVNPHTGKRRIDEAFPPAIRESVNEQEMFIRFQCGSTWQAIGSDRYNATVGAGVAGIVYSEWSLANPSAWAYHRPMLEENGGWAMFITTPRGKNHAKSMLDMARTNPKWFWEVSSVLDTGELSPEQMIESQNEYVSLYGEDLGCAQYEQEYLCSFNASIMGAFYAREMVAVRASGRVTDFDVVDGEPVYTAWDLGVRDSTAIWWFQIIGKTLYILDYYESSGCGVDHYADVIAKKPYTRRGAVDFIPHDARVKEWGSGRTRVEQMLDLGLAPKVIERSSDADGHQAIRTTLPSCVFHTRTEEAGVAALESYRREWDDNLRTFRASALHDWSSHGAKAFQYLSQAWREQVQIVPPKPISPIKRVTDYTIDEMWKMKNPVRNRV